MSAINTGSSASQQRGLRPLSNCNKLSPTPPRHSSTSVIAEVIYGSHETSPPCRPPHHSSAIVDVLYGSRQSSPPCLDHANQRRHKFFQEHMTRQTSESISYKEYARLNSAGAPCDWYFAQSPHDTPNSFKYPPMTGGKPVHLYRSLAPSRPQYPSAPPSFPHPGRLSTPFHFNVPSGVSSEGQIFYSSGNGNKSPITISSAKTPKSIMTEQELRTPWTGGTRSIAAVTESSKKRSRSSTENAVLAEGCSEKKRKKKMYSDYVGVTYNKTHAKFQACITHYRRQHYLGRYKLACDAARAYDINARKLKGDGWKVNFLTDADYDQARKAEQEKYGISEAEKKKIVTPSPPVEGKKGLLDGSEMACDSPKSVTVADEQISSMKENSSPNTSEEEMPSKATAPEGEIHKSTFEAASALMTLFCKIP